jgi:uncharacterized protein
MNFATALSVWAALLAIAVFLGMGRGYGGRSFAITMGVLGVLLGGDLFSAAPVFRQRMQAWLGARGILLAPLVPLGAFLFYSVSITGDWKWILIGASYILAPCLLVLGVREKSSIAIVDFAAILVIWLPVESRWLYKLWPYPNELTHTLTILLALNVAVAAFLFVRPLEGIGYRVEWGRGFAWEIGLNLLLVAIIVIPLGEKFGFLHFAPSLERLRSLPLAVLGISFFTAWPEELLFRGLLQNLLTRSFKNQWAGLIVASAIFGLSHILHSPFPNWKYVLLATIAGLLYGRTWMKTGTIFASAIVHACVDILWHLLFH